MSRFEHSIRYWPLFVTITPSHFGIEDVDAYIADVNRLYQRRERFATLVQTSENTAVPGALERRRLADWQNDTIDSIRRYNVFTATVVRSPLVRGAMTAMHWVFRPPNEQVVVDSFAVALERCVAKLREAGCPIPDHLAQVASNPPDSAIALMPRPSTLPPPRGL